LAAAALLALLRELRMRPGAALAAAALAMWNPYRNEIWTSLTLAEGVAMPYALFGLYCAARAARSERPLGWDLGAAFGTLAALGCKNTFAALVPVQMFLRVACAEGIDWRTALRRHGWRAALLGLTLLLPAAHFVYFKQHWHPGQYEPDGPSLAQLGRMLRSLQGAVSLDFMGAGLALAVAAVLVARRNGLAPLADCDRRTVVAGLLLIILGVGAYLPMTMVSGRYAMPAVWGLDLILAVLIGRLAELPAGAWKRSAVVGLAAGLIAVAVANVGRQEKFAARARLLWQTLECVEREADPAARVAWVSGPDLNVEEGIHFRWHLLYRGYPDLAVGLFDAEGRPEERVELPPPDKPAVLTVTGTPQPPPNGDWTLKRSFRAVYWGGRREYDCYLWSAAGGLVADRGR
jgi:hypothetical protein